MSFCSKSPVPVGGADEPPGPEERQRSKVQYVTVIMMSSVDLNSMLVLSTVCSLRFIRTQRQKASGSGGGAQTHAVPPAGRRAEHQPITGLRWRPNHCTAGERHTAAGEWRARSCYNGQNCPFHWLIWGSSSSHCGHVSKNGIRMTFYVSGNKQNNTFIHKLTILLYFLYNIYYIYSRGGHRLIFLI